VASLMCTVNKIILWVWDIDISWVDSLTRLLGVTSCIADSDASYVMVAKFRNTICPPPPQFLLLRRVALSTNAKVTQSV
jgi:hypothetical protein